MEDLISRGDIDEETNGTESVLVVTTAIGLLEWLCGMDGTGGTVAAEDDCATEQVTAGV
ncbi:MAG: hypothetical protein AB2693_21005 [Candidatus Thiodiazotropha sp.]